MPGVPFTREKDPPNPPLDRVRPEICAGWCIMKSMWSFAAAEKTWTLGAMGGGISDPVREFKRNFIKN